MTFDAKHKKSSQAICSLRRRGGEEGIRLHFSQRTPYLKKKPCRAKNKCVHRCTHRFTHMPPACADMIRILLLCSAKRKTPSTGRGFRLDLFHCFDRISRRGGAPPVQGGGSAGSKGGFTCQKGVQSERSGRPDKREFANLLNRISQMNIKRCNQQFLQIFIEVFEKEFYSLAIVFFCVKLPV